MESIQPDTRPTKQRPGRSDDLQTWTAARCNRLLRQISSRVAHLRQLVTETVDANRPPKRAAPNNDEQPEKKRVRQTYGGRKIKAAPLAEIDGNISTPPRVMRALGAMRPQMVSSPVGLCCPTPIRPPLAGDHSHLRDVGICQPEDSVMLAQAKKRTSAAFNVTQVAGMVSSDHLKLYQAILEWLERLLQLTEERGIEPGRKSLLGMCLRRVPDCLDDIDAWDLEKVETLGRDSIWRRGEAATAIYEQLEAFGSNEAGWRPFKHLVRSHALHILLQATAEGLFPQEVVTAMARSCARMRCAEEASKLLSACRETQSAKDSRMQNDSDDSGTSGPQQACNRAIMNICVGEIPVPGFLSTVGNAIETEELLVVDISPKHRAALWVTCFAALHGTSATHQGTRFLISAFQALASSDRKGPWSSQREKERMLTSLAAGAAAASITTSIRQHTRRYIHIFEAAISAMLSKLRQTRRAQHCGLFILFLARQLAMDADKTMASNLRAQAVADLESIITRSDCHTLHRQAVALTCSIAHACSRTLGKPSHAVLEELLMALHELPFPQGFSESVRSEGAFVLAQKTKDLRDLAFAENVSETQTEDTTQTPAATMFAGWRWEAGISEWVLPSPSGRTNMEQRCPATTQCGVGGAGSGQSAKAQLRLGFMPKKMRPKPRPRSITHRDPSRSVLGGTSQSYMQGAKETANTQDGVPRGGRLPNVRGTEALGPQGQGLGSCVRMTSKSHKYESVQARSDNELPIGSIGRSLVSATRTRVAEEEPWRSSGARMLGGTARSRNGNRGANGSLGLGIMRVAAATTSSSKVVRRKSTTAVSPMRGTAGADRGCRQRRRTTVSLSSLAVWPGSDDWDELL